MRLSHLHISGFRSIQEIDIDITNFCTLVGENSSGKSTILQAIDLLFQYRISIDDLDFHTTPGKQYNEITITGTFTELSQDEQDQLIGVFGPVFEKIIIKRVIEQTKSGRSSSSAYLMIPQADNKLLNPDYISGSTKSEYTEAVEKGILPEWILGSDGKGNVGDLRENIPQYLAKHADEINWSAAKEVEIKGADLKDLLVIMPEPLYVPAFDRISDHVVPKSRNILGKLLSKIFDEMAEESSQEMFRINNILNNLTRQFQQPTSSEDKRISQLISLEEKLTDFVRSVMPSSQVRLDFEKPELKDVLSSQFEIKLDDGVVTPVDRKGHGAQRTMIWALLRTYLEDLSGKGDSNVLFLVEEPELYLHPQAQRVMLGVLRQLSNNEQVVYSTHSSVFIDLSRPEEVRLIRKYDHATVLDRISDQTLSYAPNETRLLTWVDDDRAELFFAKSVILAEGDTEKVLLANMNRQRYEINGTVKSFDELGCQVVITDGKYSMPFYSSLLNDLRIPYFVIFDEDSSHGQHKQTNDHISRNVKRAKNEGLIARQKIFYPYLEMDWGIDTGDDRRKASFILEKIQEWNDKDEFPEKYENLRDSLYDFAHQVAY